ncbi:MAG: glycosyltransferase [Polyangiaceae bacterium]
MKLVVFGLAMSSSWGNGHATLWRALARGLERRGHSLTFFERDVPYYRQHRDLWELEGESRLVLYEDWSQVRVEAASALRHADIGMVTSYCPDAISAMSALFDAPLGVRAFYDLDTPVTLAALDAGRDVWYVPANGFADFDLVLSFTGGTSLDALKSRLHARQVAPLYGSVDPDVHRPVPPEACFAADLSYLGTYSADRQRALELLFVEPASRRTDAKFLLGGSQYPAEFPWRPNVFYLPHVAPPDHPAFSVPRPSL